MAGWVDQGDALVDPLVAALAAPQFSWYAGTGVARPGLEVAGLAIKALRFDVSGAGWASSDFMLAYRSR